MTVQMSRLSNISVYCLVQVLEEELKAVNDAKLRSLVNEVRSIAIDLYIVETTQNTNSLAAVLQSIHLRLSEKLREVDALLEAMEKNIAKSGK